LPIADAKQRLDRARQQALQATGRGVVKRFVPFAVAAAVALVAVLLVKPALEPDADDTRVAGTATTEVPELYEELDFYLWLADHKGDKDSRT
jgi:negative regulator of sigma E activity